MATSPKKKTKTAGNWTTAARRKLSAIRVPQASDPPDFTWDAVTAQVELKRRAATGHGKIEDVPDAPAVLTVQSETDRVNAFASWVGTVEGLNNWEGGPGGRSFTDEAWNPLVGLWLGRGGWDLVFSLIAPDLSDPMKNDLGSTDKSAPWYALRRYLHRASAAEYATLKDRVEPAFRKLFEVTKAAATSSTREQRDGRDHLAFAFDRDTGWSEELLNDFVSSSLTGILAQKRSPNLNLMLAVCADPELTLRAFAKRGFPPKDAWHVFDLVETAGAKAIPLLEAFAPGDASDRKRVAAALAIAEKLANAAG